MALAALQITRLLGGRAVVTSSADAKLEMARRLGAEGTINHTRSDVVAEFRRLTGERSGRGGGQRGRTELGRFPALPQTGRTIGDLRGNHRSPRLTRSPPSLLAPVGPSRVHARQSAGIREIVRLAGEGKLWPVIDRVYPWNDAVAAFTRLRNGEQTGKLVIEVAQ